MCRCHYSYHTPCGHLKFLGYKTCARAEQPMANYCTIIREISARQNTWGLPNKLTNSSEMVAWPCGEDECKQQMYDKANMEAFMRLSQKKWQEDVDEETWKRKKEAEEAKKKRKEEQEKRTKERENWEIENEGSTTIMGDSD